MNEHYAGRGPPQSRSMAANRVPRDGGRTEVPGQESGATAMQAGYNAGAYNKHKQERQREIEMPEPSAQGALNAQA